MTSKTHSRHVVVLTQTLQLGVVVVESILVSLVCRFAGPLLTLSGQLAALARCNLPAFVVPPHIGAPLQSSLSRCWAVARGWHWRLSAPR